MKNKSVCVCAELWRCLVIAQDILRSIWLLGCILWWSFFHRHLITLLPVFNLDECGSDVHCTVQLCCRMSAIVTDALCIQIAPTHVSHEECEITKKMHILPYCQIDQVIIKICHLLDFRELNYSVVSWIHLWDGGPPRLCLVYQINVIESCYYFVHYLSIFLRSYFDDCCLHFAIIHGQKGGVYLLPARKLVDCPRATLDFQLPSDDFTLFEQFCSEFSRFCVILLRERLFFVEINRLLAYFVSIYIK